MVTWFFQISQVVQSGMDHSLISTDKYEPIPILQEPETILPVLLGVGVLLSSFLLSTVYDEVGIYVLVLVGLVLIGMSLVDLESTFLFVPLVLTVPYTIEEFGPSIQLAEFFLLIYFSVWTIRTLSFQHQYVIPKSLSILVVTIVATAIISLLNAKYLSAGVLQIIRHIEILFVFFFVAIHSCKEADSIRRVYVLLIVGGLVSALIGLGQFLTDVQETGQVSRVFGLHGGSYGALMGSTLLFCIAALFYDSSRNVKLLALVTAIFSGVSLLLSQTRAWMLAFGLATLVVLFWTKGKILYRISASLGAVLLFVALVSQTKGFGLLNEEMIGTLVEQIFRFGSTQNSLEDLSMLMRLNVWRESMELFLQHPLLGIGVGNLRFESYFTARLSAPIEGAGHVDNQYIQIFTETGLIGGLAWIMFVVTSLRIGFRAIRASQGTPLFVPAVSFLGGVLIFVFGGFFWVITPYHESFTMMILFISLLYNIRNRFDEIIGSGGNTL